MSFSTLSEQEAREIRRAAADPSYREMNRIEAELRRRSSAGKTPAERFEALIDWLRILQSLGVRFEPSRELPTSRISRL